MLVLGNFNYSEQATIIKDAELRGCNEIYFIKNTSNQQNFPWYKCTYILCTQKAYKEFKKILEIAASFGKIVCILHKKTPANIESNNISSCYINREIKSIIGIPASLN